MNMSDMKHSATTGYSGCPLPITPNPVCRLSAERQDFKSNRIKDKFFLTLAILLLFAILRSSYLLTVSDAS